MFRSSFVLLLVATLLSLACKDAKIEKPAEVPLEKVVDSLPTTDTLQVTTDTTLKKISVVKPVPKTTIKKRPKEKPAAFPKIVYKDLVVDDATGNKAFFVEINDKKHLMRIGDVIGELELTAGDTNRIAVVFKTQRKMIERQQ
ncbi:hypothetical protein ACFQ1M_01265 [Sungkyunkwania multivorans]|uniref:Uncharacterized protein n=1 Tax=Sungkyunkwania multivorans TaxID=1173618 RepID=A0ABW3CVW7_9FLAO